MSEDITTVDSMDSAKKNSDMAESLDGSKTLRIDASQSKCYWNDAEFDEGSKVCDDGVAYECQMGLWVKLDEAC
jgi:hypothetical protein